MSVSNKPPVPPPPAARHSVAPRPATPEPRSEAVTAPHVPVAFGQPPQKPSSSPKTAAMVATLLACIAACVCYYAFTLWQSRHAAEVELTTTKGEVERLQRNTVATEQRVKVLQKEQATKGDELMAANNQVKELTAKLWVMEGKLDELADARAEVEEQLAEFKGFSMQFQKMVDSGRLKVSLRRGRMIVELPAQVLFPSGSADLTEEGEKALKEVASVLRKIRDKRFIVGGHTDNVPVNTEQFPSNWELSAARAVHVTRALVAAGVNPRRVVATGYAQYDPVATNKSTRGRQINRRIEIVLEPKLKELPGIDKEDKDE